MELILSMLHQLASSLTAGQFLMILLIIALVSGTIILFYIKHSRTPSGMFSFLQSGRAQSEKDMSEIKLQLTALSVKIDGMISEVKDLINAAFETQKERDQSIKIELTKTLAIKEEVQELYSKLNASLEDMKQVIKAQDSHEQQSSENIRNLLQHGLEAIRATHAQIGKIDDYIRDQVPQFRADNKEFAKELNDLSRDLALIERSIQTQINTVRAVTLRQ
jgi:hypothetical protein